jgi:ribonucleoside-diphosphate reductase alpha chain
MEAVMSGDESYPLINPSNNLQEGELNPREHFHETLTIRGRTGEPFMYFIDTANRALPLPQRFLGLRTHASNLCTEITLAADRKRTPVCCLSSANAEKYPEYKHMLKQFIRDLVEMLDNVLEFFIKNIDIIANNYDDEFDREFIRMILSKVRYSAERERSIGLGLMGWHYLLQRLGIPYESEEAIVLNVQIWEDIKTAAHEASCELGVERGVPPDIQEYIAKCKEQGIEPDPYWVNRRNMHLLAIAPNANNSVILATSASCEPVFANLYSQEMRIGTFTVKNRYLEALLETYGKNTVETWDQIADDGGSVQNLTFLTNRERATYRTAMEMNQLWVVRHASTRQPFVCQAQSVNFYFPPGTDINYAAAVHVAAWRGGLKSVYYYRTETDTKVERVSKQLEKDTLQEIKKTIVYGTPSCTKCGAAKALLTAQGIEYEYVDLIALGKTAAEVTGRPVRSVPQIYVAGEYVGGLDELMKYLAARKSPDSEEEGDDSGECVACQA